MSFSKDTKIVVDKKATNSNVNLINYLTIGTGVVTISVFSYYIYKQLLLEEKIKKLEDYDQRILLLAKKLENVEKLLRINGTDSLMLNKILLEVSKVNTKLKDKEEDVQQGIDLINDDLDKIIKDLNETNKEYKLVRASRKKSKKSQSRKNKKSKKNKFIGSDSESENDSDSELDSEDEIKNTKKYKRYSKTNRRNKNKEEDSTVEDIFSRQ